MKHYFIVDRDVWENFPKEHFTSSHWIETHDPTKLLVVAQFNHESAHEAWEKFDGVEALPNVFHSTEKVADHHHSLLSHIGVKPGDSSLDVAKKAALVHPMFHPHRF